MPIPNDMNIVPPVAGSTPGPQWANDLNNILTDQIANHTHTGNPDGSLLSQTALNIDGDLSLNGNSLTAVERVALSNSSTSPQSLWSTGGNLYWTPAAGSAVQITAGSAINVTAFGGISGLPNGSAGAAYDASGYFKWNKSTTAYADMWSGKLKIYDSAVGAPTNAVILSSPTSMVADITLTLPKTLPAATGSLLVSPSGVLTASAPNAANENITNTTWTTGGATILTTSYVPTGRRVLLTLTNVPGSAGYLKCANTSAFSDTWVEGQLNLIIDGVTVSTLQYREIFSYATTAEVYIQPALSYIWTPADADVGTSVTIELVGYDISNLAGRTIGNQFLRLQLTDI